MSIDIAIRLPLPLGVAGAVMELIGTAWPGSVIVQQEGAQFGQRDLAMRIGDDDPVPVDTDTARAIGQSAHVDGAVLNGFGPDGTLSLGNTEEMNEVMARACVAAFDASPDAVNYLEAEIHRRGDDHRYVVIYARSKGQTPHELRQAAEQRLYDAEEAIEALFGVDERRGSFEDGIQAALNAVREARSRA